MQRPVSARSAASFGVIAVLAFVATFSATAADTVSVRVGSTQATTPTVPSLSVSSPQLDTARQLAQDQADARVWGLSVDEIVRARGLMRGPRGAFSGTNISPIEVLGIHARTPAERARYAELFARILHDDTSRVLAWSVAHASAMARLYPNEPVMDFGGKKLPRTLFGTGGQ